MLSAGSTENVLVTGSPRGLAITVCGAPSVSFMAIANVLSCFAFSSVLANLGPPMNGFRPVDRLNHQRADLVGVKTVGRADRQQRHVTLAQDYAPHLTPIRDALDFVRALAL